MPFPHAAVQLSLRGHPASLPLTEEPCILVPGCLGLSSGRKQVHKAGIRLRQYVETASFQCQSHPGKYQYPNGSLSARSWATPQKKRMYSGDGGGCSSHFGRGEEANSRS
ncbi:hypothetical protein CapIbe_023869 [Capra ibex]